MVPAQEVQEVQVGRLEEQEELEERLLGLKERLPVLEFGPGQARLQPSHLSRFQCLYLSGRSREL